MYLPFQPGKDDYPKACDPKGLCPQRREDAIARRIPLSSWGHPLRQIWAVTYHAFLQRNRNPGTPSEVCGLKKAELPPHTCGSGLLFPPNWYLEGLRSKLCFLIILVLQKIKITRNLNGVSKSPWSYKMFDDFYYCVSVPTQERNAG